MEQDTRDQGYSLLRVKTSERSLFNMAQALVSPLGPSSGFSNAMMSVAEQLRVLQDRFNKVDTNDAETLQIQQNFVG